MGVRKDKAVDLAPPRTCWGGAASMMFAITYHPGKDGWQWSLHEVPARGKEVRRPRPMPAIAVSPYFHSKAECIAAIDEFQALARTAEVRTVEEDPDA